MTDCTFRRLRYTNGLSCGSAVRGADFAQFYFNGGLFDSNIRVAIGDGACACLTSPPNGHGIDWGTGTVTFTNNDDSLGTNLNGNATLMFRNNTATMMGADVYYKLILVDQGPLYGLASFANFHSERASAPTGAFIHFDTSAAIVIKPLMRVHCHNFSITNSRSPNAIVIESFHEFIFYDFVARNNLISPVVVFKRGVQTNAHAWLKFVGFLSVRCFVVDFVGSEWKASPHLKIIEERFFLCDQCGRTASLIDVIRFWNFRSRNNSEGLVTLD